MKGPGGLFERQVRASLPRWPRLAHRKVPDPPARPFRCRCGGQIAPKCDRCGSAHGHPAVFTRGNPWDIEVRWQRPEGGLYELLLECKSVEGKKPLPFDRVRPDQVAEMLAASQAGSFAGILWEARESPTARTVVYLPIATWAAAEATMGRKSYPLGDALQDGIVVPPDPKRGRRHWYYQMHLLLRELVGECSTQERP